MPMIVYLISNTVNDKVYVGITSKSAKARYSQHVWCAANGSNYAIHRAMRSHGVDAFTISVLATCDDFEAIKAIEVAEIHRRNAFGHGGYNMTRGGDGIIGFAHSEDTRAKIRAAHSGKKLSSEHIAALVTANTGRKMPPAHVDALRNRVVSEEDRAARRDRAMGNKWSVGIKRTDAQKEAVRVAATGRVMSDETKQKIRAARAKQDPTYGMAGKSHDDETKAKMRAAKLGKKKSPETIERMKRAAKKRWEVKRAGTSNPKAEGCE